MGPEEIKVKLVVARPLTREEEITVVAHIGAALRYPFRIALRYLDAVPRGPTGKFEEFVSELDT